MQSSCLWIPGKSAEKNPDHEHSAGGSEAGKVARGHRRRAGTASKRHRNVKSQLNI